MAAATVLLALVKLLIVGLGLLYAGLVLMSYKTEGRHYQPRLRLAEPARSGERLLVWGGVKALDASVRASRAVLDTLYDASAEVGGWVISMSSPETQNKVRSRFL